MIEGWKAGLAAGVLAACLVTARGGVLENARALLSAGKHGDVDVVLAPLLSQTPPSLDALLLSFEAAVADGRLYAAERRAMAVLDGNGKPSASFLHAAADVAGKLGKDGVRRDRLVYFLQVEPGATPQVRNALAELCSEGGDAAFFIRYVKAFGPDADALDLGLLCLLRQREGGRSAEYLKLADYLLGAWAKQPNALRRVIGELAAAKRANVYGITADGLTELILAHGITDERCVLDWMWSPGGWGETHSTCEALLALQEKTIPALLPLPLFRAFMNLHGVAPGDRDAFAKRVWALRQAAMQSTNTAYACAMGDQLNRFAQHFFQETPPLVSPSDSLALARRMLTGLTEYDSDICDSASGLFQNGNWNEVNKTNFVADFPRLLRHDVLHDWYADRIVKGKDVALLRDVLYGKGADRTSVHRALFLQTLAVGNRQIVEDSTGKMLSENPADLGFVETLLATEALSMADRVAIVGGCFRRTGWTDDWKRLLEKGLPHGDDPAVQAMVATFKPEIKGSEPYLTGLTEIWRMQRGSGNTPPDGVHNVARRILDGFPGTYPRGGDAARNGSFQRFAATYADLCRFDREACKTVVAALLPRLGRETSVGVWNSVINAASWSGDPQVYRDAVVKKMAIYGGYVPEVANVTEAERSDEAMASPYYAQMSGRNASEYVWRNANGRWPERTSLREIAKLFSQADIADMDTLTLFRLTDLAARWREDAATVAATMPVERLAEALFDNGFGGDASRENLLRLYWQRDQLDAGIARYLAGAAKRSPLVRQNALAALLEWSGPNDTALLARKTPEEELTSSNSVLNLTETVFRKSLEEAPFHGGVAIPIRNLRHLDGLRGKLGSAAADARIDAVAERQMVALGEGARRLGSHPRMHAIAVNAAEKALARGDGRALSALCHAVAEIFDRSDQNQQLTLIAELNQASRWETAYLLADAILRRDPDASPDFARLRTEAAAHMTGVYPVAENDPTFPLYVAADELLLGRNTERAWFLLNRNLAVFEKDPLRYPPLFIAWAVEQLRNARGDRDAMLDKAAALVDAMLIKEKQLPDELAASLMLTKAEIARDRRRFDTAHLDYQAIRNHPAYQKTSAGRKAMFRDVDLMIVMGNAAGAEQTVEQWLSTPDPELQAQAHCILARIAFDHKDYEATRRQLDEVFAIDFTHTEARLLYGQWKLATNYEVDDTQVLVGTLADRTLIRPGQPLTLTVHDPNLGVAGGGTGIPILVETSVGKDVETVSLHPSPRNPSLFRGVIDTALAAAAPGNLVLDVIGSDTVSYRISPEFLSERGLKAFPPKMLRVVDDAELAVGATVPDAQEGAAENELLSALADGPVGPRRALTSNLRPGSPLYIAVRDADQSLTSGQDSVWVSIRTGSGDRLPHVELKETDPFSGIFRAAVPTRLPPPLATASDSASGVNPCDAINSRRNGSWRSLPDGRQGKWIEVDTMGSHLVAEATAEMPAAASVSLLRLYGRLGYDERLLAVFPGDDSTSRGGIRIQQSLTGMWGATHLRRGFQSGKRDSQPVDEWKVVFEGSNHHDQRAMLSGFICPEAPCRARLRFQPAPPPGCSDLMPETLLELALDGRRIFSGRGHDLVDQVVELSLLPEPQLLEVFVGGRRENDSVRLGMELADGSIGRIPAAWTDPAKNAKLAELLADKAIISRTDTGFKAAFVKPERLRALRWEFTDFAGNEAEVKSLGIVDANGAAIVPVGSDYSDALGNDMLEVVPGDPIFVTYSDAATSGGEKRIIERNLSSSFHDGAVSFLFENFVEDRDGRPRRELDAAYRIRPGDALLIQVSDPDMDATPEADAVAVQVSAGDQPPLTLSAVEERDPGAPEGVETYVGGVFHALLKTVDASDAAAVAASPKALPIRPGDIVRAVYLDRENTLPGIPVDREGRVMVCGAEQPVLQLYRTWRESVEDKGERAQGRLRQIQRRPGNERATMILRDIFHAEPMPSALLSASNAVPVNAAVPIPIAVYDASRARHARSTLQVEAMAASELEAAKAEGRSPEGVKVELALDELPKGIRFKSEAGAVAQTEGSMRFCGLLRLALGADGSDAEILPSTQVDEEAPPVLRATGSDRILLRVIGEDGGGQIERWLRLVSDARLRLMDSTYEAERNTVHLGDRFNVLLEDFERDVSPTQDVVVVEAEAAGSGVKRRIELTETMPHSGRFSGGVRPVFFGTNAVPEDLGDQLPVAYGDAVAFRYEDAETVPGTEPGVISAAGVVSQGADGDVRLYSKRFRSPDQAVQVQFRMAECLFEVAKEQRKLGHLDKGAKSVAEGRRILEAALRENPGTDHAEQGQYLLGHLNQELAEERKDAGDMDGARPFFQEAISRFSEILSAWPEGPYAPQAQYHKALCLEMLGDYSRAGEEYVKMTYLHPNSPLVGDATIRLATYYYSQEKRYDTAARIYENFHKRFPTHERAAAALFMGAQCHVKQAESLWGEDFGKGGMPPLVEEQYLKAIDAFNLLIQTYQGGGDADQKLRAQAMYWVGDASCWIHDDKNAYLAFKRVIFEYPETEWARRARGRLLQDAKRFESLQ